MTDKLHTLVQRINEMICGNYKRCEKLIIIIMTGNQSKSDCNSSSILPHSDDDVRSASELVFSKI